LQTEPVTFSESKSSRQSFIILAIAVPHLCPSKKPDIFKEATLLIVRLEKLA